MNTIRASYGNMGCLILYMCLTNRRVKDAKSPNGQSPFGFAVPYGGKPAFRAVLPTEGDRLYPKFRSPNIEQSAAETGRGLQQSSRIDIEVG